MISIRLSKYEEAKLEEMKQKTGLSTTALIKKKLFDESTDNMNINKDILSTLGNMSTCINVTKRDFDQKEYDVIKTYLDKLETDVMSIWQSL